MEFNQSINKNLLYDNAFMKINIDRKSLEISSRKVITGTISVGIDKKRFFPEENWNDTVVTILNSWIQNMIQILRVDHSEGQFTFFDGPFYFIIRRSGDHSLVELSWNSKSIETYHFDLMKFGYSLLKSSQEVLKEINAKEWESEDVTQLRLSIVKMLLYLDLKNKEN